MIRHGLVSGLLWGWVTVAAAHPDDGAQVPLGVELGCRTCHLAVEDLSQINGFGQAFRAAERTWGAGLAAGDADEDGLSNGTELLDPDGVWRPGQPSPGSVEDATWPAEAQPAPEPVVPPPPPPAECPAVPIAATCASDAECGEGGRCFAGVDGGYCTVLLDEGCCPSGSRADEVMGMCVRACEGGADCEARPGGHCSLEGVCWGCRAPVEAPLGDPCGEHADCGAQASCVTTWGESAVEGGVCLLDSPAWCCPAGTREVEFSGAKWCAPICRFDADCAREGWGCDHTLQGVCRPGARSPDAGVLADAGVPDAGANQRADAGVSDAGAHANSDTESGCALSGASRGKGSWLWLIGVGWVMSRRRRWVGLSS